MIQTINPDVAPVQLYSAVQDTLWRSPTAMWPVLIDSCRVRGIFSSALKLPSVQSAIEVVGGYCQPFDKQTETENLSQLQDKSKKAVPMSQEEIVSQMVHRVYKIVILS